MAGVIRGTREANPVTAPSWAEARKVEEVAIALVRMASAAFAKRPTKQKEAEMAEVEQQYLAARRASDVALVRKVLAYAESVCESRRRSLHDNHQIMAALEASKCGMAIVSRGAEAVLAEIQKEEG